MSGIGALKRPAGFPEGFGPVMCCWLVGFGLLPHCTMAVVDAAVRAQGQLHEAAMPYSIGFGAIFGPLFFMASRATPARLRIFWALGVMLATVTAGLCATVLVLFTLHHDTIAEKAMTDLSAAGCVVLVGLEFPLFLRLRRLRWMDPEAKPEEWEPIMVSKSVYGRTR